MKLSLTNRQSLWVGLGLGVLTLALTVRLFYYPSPIDSTLVLLSLAAWLITLVTPLVIALHTVYARRRDAEYGVPQILSRWRVLLALVIGVMPLMTLLTLYTIVGAEAQNQNDVGCVTDPITAHQFYSYICDVQLSESNADWMGQSLTVLAATFGLWGMIAFGIGMGLKFPQMPYLATGILCVAAIFVLLTGANTDIVEPGLSAVRFAVVLILPYVLGFILIRTA